jgi:hypothetical protein
MRWRGPQESGRTPPEPCWYASCRPSAAYNALSNMRGQFISIGLTAIFGRAFVKIFCNYVTWVSVVDFGMFPSSKD